MAYDADRDVLFVGTGSHNEDLGGGRSERSDTDLPWSDGVLAIHADSGEMAWFFQLVEEDSGRDLDVGASPNLFTIGDRAVVGVGGKSGD